MAEEQLAYEQWLERSDLSEEELNELRPSPQHDSSNLFYD